MSRPSASTSATWRPDLVVREETDFGSAMAAELEGVPCATLVILAAGTLARPELVSPGPPGRAGGARPGPRPDARVLQPRPGALALPARLSRPSVTAAGRHLLVPAAAGRRRRPRGGLVYVTLGTVFNTGSGDLFERLLAGLAGVPAEVLVTVGRGIEPAELGAAARAHPRGAVRRPGRRAAPVRSRRLARWLRQPDGRTRPRPPLGADAARRRPAPQRRDGPPSSGSQPSSTRPRSTPEEVERAVTAMLADTRARASGARPEGRDRRAAAQSRRPCRMLERLAGH